MTGATGAIGSFVAKLLLEQPKTRLFLLIRAESESHLQHRLAQLCSFWQIRSDDLQSKDRIRALIGNTQAPCLGLKDSDYKYCLENITHIIHAAGNVKLNQSLDDAIASAVTPTAELVSLARKARRNGVLQKLDYISTVGVAGRISGRIMEERITESREYRNTYEAAKAQAERHIWNASDEGLPITIHRPSMVIGDSRTGATTHFQVFYHLLEFLSGKKTLGIIPDPLETCLDVIPVDIVSKAVVLSCNDLSQVGKVFHLASGSNAVLLRKLVEVLQEYLQANGETLPDLRLVPSKWFKRILPFLKMLSSKKGRKALNNLYYFLTYLDEPQVFDNTNFAELLSHHSYAIPLFDDYFGNIMKYYRLRR